MQISIKAPTFLWFLPNSTVHLTEESPGPIEVDFETLSKENQRLVILAIKNNNISASEPLETLITVYNPKVKIENKIAVANTDEKNNSATNSEEDLKLIAIKKLNMTLGSIKKFVAADDNIRLLRVMLELEKSTHNRSSLLQAIESKLNTLSEQIKTNIEQNSKSTVQAIPPDPIADQFNIVDSEIEDRIVEIER